MKYQQPESSASARRGFGITWKIGVSLLLLVSIALVATRSMARWHHRQGSLEGLQKAVRWDPQNDQYYADLARNLQLSTEPAVRDEVIRLFEEATRRGPHRAETWAELAKAYEWAGRSQDARNAYSQALRLFPNSPDVSWQSGNFYLRNGETVAALRAFRTGLLADPEMRRQAFDLAWRAGADPAVILAEMIPARADVMLQYLLYLVETRHTDAAGQVWARLLEMDAAMEPRAAFPYLDRLIEERRVNELASAWAVLAKRNPGRMAESASESSLITNGDFENEMLNGGLDWRAVAVNGVEVRTDTTVFFDGTHSVRVFFDGKHNVDYGHFFQYVIVEPRTKYRFTGYLRAAGITTNSGPRFEIYDPDDWSRLFVSTDGATGTVAWSQQHLEFQTGPQTRLVVIRLARPPSQKFDNLIAGTVWIDHLSLRAVEQVAHAAPAR